MGPKKTPQSAVHVPSYALMCRGRRKGNSAWQVNLLHWMPLITTSLQAQVFLLIYTLVQVVQVFLMFSLCTQFSACCASTSFPIVFLCTHSLTELLQSPLIRFDGRAITLRGPTVGVTEPIVIIDTRQLFHSGPTMYVPIIGFKCMTSAFGPQISMGQLWRGRILCCHLSICKANLTIVQFKTGNLAW